jgi:hypothetical protein
MKKLIITFVLMQNEPKNPKTQNSVPPNSQESDFSAERGEQVLSVFLFGAQVGKKTH